MSDGFFDRDAIVAGRGRGRRRRTMLFLVESFSDPDGPDAGAALDFLATTEVFGGLDRGALRGLLPHLEPVHVGAGEAVPPGDTLLLVGHGRVEVEVADTATVEDVWTALTTVHPVLSRYRPHTLFAIGTDYVEASHPVRPGEEVACFPPVSGGVL